jgi:phage-related minor tail protein
MDVLIPVALFVCLFAGMVVFWQGFHVGEPRDPGSLEGELRGRAARSAWTNSSSTMPPGVQRHRARGMAVGAGLILAAVVLGIIWSASA